MVSEHPDVKSCGQAMLQALGEVSRQKHIEWGEEICTQTCMQ